MVVWENGATDSEVLIVTSMSCCSDSLAAGWGFLLGNTQWNAFPGTCRTPRDIYWYWDLLQADALFVNPLQKGSPNWRVSPSVTGDLMCRLKLRSQMTYIASNLVADSQNRYIMISIINIPNCKISWVLFQDDSGLKWWFHCWLNRLTLSQ